MSSWLSRSKKSSVTNLRADDNSGGRSTTPTPDHPDGRPRFRSGILTIRVLWAEGLNIPQGTQIPPAVNAALSSSQAKLAASVSPSSVTQQRLAKTRGNRCVLLEHSLYISPHLTKIAGIAFKERNAGGFLTSSSSTRSIRS
jgi:serum/glucocorticoid-regulated kinase 2